MTIAPTSRLTEAELLAELERLPAQQAAAVRVLYVADDPTSSAPDLAEAVRADPVLTAQVMRLANSAYYGLSGRVRSADFAVTLLGFAAVRALAAAHATGVLGADAEIPADFWRHAAASAAGTAQVSARLGVARPDAFSLGLLHDLGSALLCQLDPVAYRECEQRSARPDTRQGALFEKRVFGMDHAAVAATVLGAWRFPDELVEAIATHHEPPSATSTKLQRCLAAGQALAVLALLPDDQRIDSLPLLERHEGDLRLGDVDPRTAFDLSRTVRTEAIAIASSFS